MELDAGDIDDEAEQDGEASEVGLAATLSTSAVLNVADGVVMPTPTNVDTTRLTGALVGLQLRERVQGEGNPAICVRPRSVAA